MSYDPFEDSLSASTRNGATLKLNVGVTGLFSDTRMPSPILPHISEDT
jgi:hypothetical protein